MHQLDKIDDSFDAMADRKHHDDQDKYGGDVQISLLTGRRLQNNSCLPSYCSEDDHIEQQKRKKWQNVENDGKHWSYLEKKFFIAKNKILNDIFLAQQVVLFSVTVSNPQL